MNAHFDAANGYTISTFYEKQMPATADKHPHKNKYISQTQKQRAKVNKTLRLRTNMHTYVCSSIRSIKKKY